ncbi:hypothetical protein ACQF36_23465 [Streptomyces sp. Marseille-Q5077]|uniref:hypothetical protein n=1 Tax=Streptomyces sp. Marseille-Q5077 TaxID=3418995 RepID=UPI003D02D6BC
MYALIVPASTPFVLLATVMALSWWEDHILPTPTPTPPAESAEAPAEAPFTPTAIRRSHPPLPRAWTGAER